METLRSTLREAMQAYAGLGANAYAFFMCDEKHDAYAVNLIDHPVRIGKPVLVLLARMVEDTIVIEADNTDKPLVEALLEQGIPRQQIVLAYAGETLHQDVQYN